MGRSSLGSTPEAGLLEQNSRHYTRKRRHYSSKRRIILILSLALVIETVLLVVAYVRMSLAESENRVLVISERKQSEELQQLRPQVEKLRKEVTALTESRLPGLRRLELALNQAYIKNIVFSVAGKGDDLEYEYKMTARNASLNLVHPQVDILFFDRLGIQVGISRIGVNKEGAPTLDILERGESRSYSQNIALHGENRPEYFRLRIYK